MRTAIFLLLFVGDLCAGVRSAIKDLRDLCNLQMTAYAEIVCGVRELDCFDTFVE